LSSKDGLVIEKPKIQPEAGVEKKDSSASLNLAQQISPFIFGSEETMVIKKQKIESEFDPVDLSFHGWFRRKDGNQKAENRV
jgi:hypothetical protein